MTGKENLNSNPTSLPKCQTQEQAEEVRMELVELRTNLEDLNTRLENLSEQIPASSMRIGLLERYKEVTKRNFDLITRRLDELLTHYVQDQKKLAEIQFITYALRQQQNMSNQESPNGKGLLEEKSQHEVQTIPTCQMASMGRKGDYRIEVEDNDLFPIGSLVAIGESFVVQVIDHGSLILEMPLPRDFLKGTIVRGISEDDQFIFDQHGNQVFQGCLMEDRQSMVVPQDSHLQNGKPPGLEEVQPTIPTALWKAETTNWKNGNDQG